MHNKEEDKLPDTLKERVDFFVDQAAQHPESIVVGLLDPNTSDGTSCYHLMFSLPGQGMFELPEADAIKLSDGLLVAINQLKAYKDQKAFMPNQLQGEVLVDGGVH